MAPTDEERQDKAPMTGVMSLHDVLRHLVHFGPARNDAERTELLAAVNDDDPDAPEPDEAPLSDAEKIRQFDAIQRQRKAEEPAEPELPAPGPFLDGQMTASGHFPGDPAATAAAPAADPTGGNG